jgi:hypothetical protein
MSKLRLTSMTTRMRFVARNLANDSGSESDSDSGDDFQVSAMKAGRAWLTVQARLNHAAPVK